MSRACALLLRVALSPAATHHKSAFLVSVAHSLGQRILLPLFHLLAAERAADVQIKRTAESDLLRVHTDHEH